MKTKYHLNLENFFLLLDDGSVAGLEMCQSIKRIAKKVN
jgi:hypothetical protein